MSASDQRMLARHVAAAMARWRVERRGAREWLPAGFQELEDQFAAWGAAPGADGAEVEVPTVPSVSMSRVEAARVLRVDVSTIDRWIRSGRLRASKAGPRRVVIDRASVDALRGA